MENQQFQSPAITNLAKALIQVQKDLQPAQKDAENPFTKSQYATFNAVMEVCRNALLNNGIWLCQYPVPVEVGHLGLVTKLTHAESGEWQSSCAIIPLPKADPQAYGSCITYAKRYALTAMLGIVTEDDDAESARNNVTNPKQKRTNAQNQIQKSNNSAPETKSTQIEQNQTTKTAQDFPSLPKLDGIAYQQMTAQDGKICIVATGNTQPKKDLLASAGFKWNADRKLWWKYADAT